MAQARGSLFASRILLHSRLSKNSRCPSRWYDFKKACSHYIYKRKARGKENNPGAISTGLSAGAYAGACERMRAREARRKREIGAAVEDALVAFCGTRRNPLFDLAGWKDPCDERLWANAAWDVGLGRFLDLIELTKSQIRQKPFVVPDRDKPRYFQENLNPFWKGSAR